MRITRDTMFMEIAHTVSKRATCFRLNVGAVGVSESNNLVSIGYNGREAGLPHCEGDQCRGRFSCQETIHAEVNALSRAQSPVHTLYVTDSPCENCCKALVKMGVKRVVFDRPYRITEHLGMLRDNGMIVHRITSAGYVVDWFTKAMVE